MEYTQLAADELIDRAYSARDEFNSLYESNDISDGTLDRMASLVDELEALQTEADSRVALAILNEKREELARKVKKKTLFLPGETHAPSTLPSQGPGIGVGFAKKEVKDDDSPSAGVDLAVGGDDKKDSGTDKSVPELLSVLRTAEKGSPEAKAAKAGLAAAMKKKASGKGKDDKVAAQTDAPYKQDLTPKRAEEIKVTDAVEPVSQETADVEKKAASSKTTLAINKDVEPIEHMPTKGFPVGDKAHPGASTIKSGTVKGLKVPKPASPVAYSEEDPIAFAEPATKNSLAREKTTKEKR